MKNKKLIWISGLVIILFIISLYFDSNIIQGISYIKSSVLDSFFIKLTPTSFEVILFIAITGLFLWKKSGRKFVLPLWFSWILSFLISFLLKVIIQKPRPFQDGLIEISSFLVKNSYLIWDFSFPSSHTVFAFCAVPFLSKEFPRLKYFWIFIACLVGFSRIYFGLHFLSDVIAGAAIGYLVGALIINAEKENKFWERLYWRFYNLFVR